MRHFIYAATVMMTVLAALTAPGQDVRSVHIYGGRGPTLNYKPGSSVVVSSHDYIALLDANRKAPIWAAYQVAVGHSTPPSRRFVSRYPDVSLETNDFTHSGYDRGHLVARRLVDASPFMFEVDDMSVVAAMTPELNQGPWAALERSIEKEAVETNDNGYVIAGSLWEKTSEVIDDGLVPSKFWMVVTFASDSRTRRRAYIMIQDVERDDDFETMQVSLDKIEDEANLRLH